MRGLATEFGGNWLDFRHFETNNAVDRERFPSFNDDLREAMFQEPIRFIEDVDPQRPLRPRPAVRQLHVCQSGAGQALRHAGSARRRATRGCASTMPTRYGRGGLLPMAVFLTENSPGLRTSPVKRGYWVVHRVLGEVIPPPPPVVPELPARRSEVGPAAARDAGAASRESGLRRLPCALRFLRPGV